MNFKTLFPSRFPLYLIAATVLAILQSTPALAGGYALQEQSAVGLGQAFAGTSTGLGDGSSVWYNAAAMTTLDRDTASATVHLIIPSADFTDEGSTLSPALGGSPIGGTDGVDGGETAAVANAYFVKTINDDLRLGFGVNTPFGLATDYSRTWVGRYHGVKSELLTVNLNPAVGYRVNDWLSVGGGLSVIYLDAELSNAIDFGSIGFSRLGPTTAGMLGLVPGGSDGYGVVKGDDWGYGYQLGFLLQPTEKTRLGFQFRSKIDATLKGDASFEVPSAATALTSTGAFTNSDASADITLPESVSMGIHHQATEKLAFVGEALWTGWSRFPELRIKFANGMPDSVVEEGWDDTWRFAGGFNYHCDSDWSFRGGIAFEDTPISGASYRTPRIPDSKRFWMTAGVGYQATDSLNVNLAFAHLVVSEGEVANTASNGSTLLGSYDSTVDIVSIELTGVL